LSTLSVHRGREFSQSGVEATGSPQEPSASGYGITNLDVSIENLFGLKHHAKSIDLVNCRVMKMLTGILNFVLGLKKLDNITKRLHGYIFI
jgi:hypothetical protein